MSILSYQKYDYWKVTGNAEVDRVAKELAEAKNQLDGIKLQARKALEEATDATDEQKKPVEDLVGEAQQALDSELTTKDRLEAIGRDLADKLQAFTQSVSQQPGGQGAGHDDGGRQEPHQGDDDVIDAEFKPAG